MGKDLRTSEKTFTLKVFRETKVSARRGNTDSAIRDFEERSDGVISATDCTGILGVTTRIIRGELGAIGGIIITEVVSVMGEVIAKGDLKTREIATLDCVLTVRV